MACKNTLCTLLLFCLLPLACAQFQFFEQMFGQGHPGQQQRQSSNPAQWAAQAEASTSQIPASLPRVTATLFLTALPHFAVPCSHYLCPDTLVCVSNPTHCPCPNAEDVRCMVPDAEEKGGATVLCVRGASDCAEVEKLTRKFAK